jgi:nitrate reductase gamma subunit
MDYYINQLLFGIYPYVALATFLVGSLIRYDREQYSWKASSSQLLSGRWMRLGSNFFHIGILLILAGHFVGLLTPHEIYSKFITVEAKQKLAMMAGGIFGAMCFVGITILVWRRLFNPRVRATSRVSDIAVLLILYVQLILGLSTIAVSMEHLDGSSMVALAHWAQHIVTFRAGAADFVLDEHIVFKLHIVLGLTLFLIFPFTRLVHVWSLPIGYLSRTGYQIVRSRRARR